MSISQYQKYHNTLCFSLQNFAQILILFSLGTYNGPKRNWKQCLCKMLEGQTKSIMVFLILANITQPLISLCSVSRFDARVRLQELFCFLTEPHEDQQWQARVWLSRMTDSQISGGSASPDLLGEGANSNHWPLGSGRRTWWPSLLLIFVTNVCYSHLRENFIERSALNLIITFASTGFHQSVEK